MNIKEFLLDNYIWIIVVILLTIITVIGFLADKKKNKKEKASNTNNVPNQGMNPGNIPQTPITYGMPGPVPNNSINNGMYGQPMNMNPGMNQMINNNPIPVSNDMLNTQVVSNPIPETPEPIMNYNNINNSNIINPQEQTPITPVVNNIEPIATPEPVNNVSVEESMHYQGFGEQKPSFAPQSPEVLMQNYNNQMENSAKVTPEQVAPAPANFGYTETPQPMNFANPIPNTIPQGVVPMPIPNNNVGPMPSPIPNPVPTPTPNVTNPENGFVYGGQNNNQ